jgi:hypothetical protein
MWRVDAIKTIAAVPVEPEWYLDQRTAERRADELMKQGYARSVAWFDAQGKGIPRDEGRQLVREGLQRAFGWLRVDEALEGTA